MTPKHNLIQDIRNAAAESANFLSFIDLLADRGIETAPRMKCGFGYLSIRFERDGLSITRGQSGVRFEGPLAYSVSRYDPVLRYMQEARSRGEPQARVLDEAGEVALPIQLPSAALYPSLAMKGAIQRIVISLAEDGDAEDALRALNAGYDGWLHLDETSLRSALRDPVIPEIEELPDPHRMAALRWACRFQELDLEGYGVGDVQELAVKRQLALLGPEPGAACQDADPAP